MTTNPVDARAYGWISGEREDASPVRWLSRWGMSLLSFFAKAADSGDSSYGGGGGSTPGRGYGGGDDDPGYYGKGKSYREPDPPVPPGDDKCCSLYYPDGPFCEFKVRRADYTCPEGWFRQWWFCMEGTRPIGCGECTRSTTTCWQGPFLCSIWWYADEPC